MARIEIGRKDQELLDKLGIELEPGIGQMAGRYVALGRVLNAISKLERADQLWVLSEARRKTSDQESVIENTINKEGFVYPIGYVIETVARRYSITIKDIQGRIRSREIAEARQVAMYFLRMFNAYSLEEVGQALGGRTPATVTHGFQTIANKINRDIRLKNIIERIKTDLQ